MLHTVIRRPMKPSVDEVNDSKKFYDSKKPSRVILLATPFVTHRIYKWYAFFQPTVTTNTFAGHTRIADTRTFSKTHLPPKKAFSKLYELALLLRIHI